MSNADASREWRFYIEDMIAFCERVQSFTHGINRADFISDPMRYDATVRTIELIGETSTMCQIQPSWLTQTSPSAW